MTSRTWSAGPGVACGKQARRDIGAGFLAVAVLLAASAHAANADRTSPERIADTLTDAAPRGTPSIVDADPTDYLVKLRSLRAGDTLRLAPGRYHGVDGTPGLPLYRLHGRPGAPIVITGPEHGPRPVFLGTARHNTVRIADSSHLVLRRIDIDGRDLGGDAVNGQGPSEHITLEEVSIRGVGNDQGTVGISTNRAPAAYWTIRRCTIVGAGTGLYLGNSDGRNPFVAGTIEHNVVVDTIGYNVQVKHQAPWPDIALLPTGRTVTVIRHNVFGKARHGASGPQARPNLLIGDVPVTGAGRDNGYEVYGNIFYQNPHEVLLQAEGNVAIYANVLVNDGGGGIAIQRHNGHVRDVRVFGNTIVTAGTGIAIVGGDPSHEQEIAANAVFAALPINGGVQRNNVTGPKAQAASLLADADARDDTLDLAPKSRALRGSVVDTRSFRRFTDWDRDFDGRPRDWRVRGAYSRSADRAEAGSRRPVRLAVEP